MNVCACMGPQNGDPVCPCRMKAGHSVSYFGAEFLPLTRPLAPPGYPAILLDAIRRTARQPAQDISNDPPAL